MTDLLLHEELLLLALNDEEGSGRSDLAVAGGLLAELSLRAAVVVEKRKRAVMVTVTDAGADASTGDELLDECLEDLRTSKKERTATHWVTKFSQKKDLKHRVAGPLVERGILDENKRKFLFIQYTRYPELNPLPEAEMTERLRNAIEYDHAEPTDRTVALVALADAASLLRNNLDKKMLRARRKHIKELAEGATTAEVVKAAIEATAAAMVVLVAATAAT